MVVIDELVGQWIAFLPFAALSLWGYVLGFVLFRVFDIAKPFPCRRLERLPAGWGIMADDWAAAAWAAALLALARSLGLV